MSPYQTRTFTHGNKEYEIRIASDGYTTRVRAFLDGKPANGYSYSVDLFTQGDAKMVGGSDPLEELINTAETDVKNGIWEQYVAAVEAQKQSEA